MASDAAGAAADTAASAAGAAGGAAKSTAEGAAYAAGAAVGTAQVSTARLKSTAPQPVPASTLACLSTLSASPPPELPSPCFLPPCRPRPAP